MHMFSTRYSSAAVPIYGQYAYDDFLPRIPKFPSDTLIDNYECSPSLKLLPNKFQDLPNDFASCQLYNQYQMFPYHGDKDIPEYLKQEEENESTFYQSNPTDEKLSESGSKICLTPESQKTISNTDSFLTKQEVCAKYEPLSPTNQSFTAKYDQPKSSKQPKKVQSSKKIYKKRKGSKKGKRVCEKLKNIVKNYGKNSAIFALSDEAKQYTGNKFTEEEYHKFEQFVKPRIPDLINIPNFRDILMPTSNDDQLITRFKNMYQELTIIFIKYYSFNWIFNSPRIKDIKGHVQMRNKMLRRVQNPANFTYIH